MSIPLSGHQRVALLRRHPGLVVEVRSISEVRFRIGDHVVLVTRPPYSTWMVTWPYVIGTMRHPPSDQAIWSLRATLIAMIEGPTSVS